MELKKVRRGYDKSDERFFSEKEVKRLKEAQGDIIWMIDRGYKLDKVMELVGGKYQFSARQRTALMRSSSNTEKVDLRKEKLKTEEAVRGGKLNIDGFNLIVTLEVALSDSLLIMGYDCIIRDLAGLRGTYKIVDKTVMALEVLGRALGYLNVEEVVIYLDQPVSNSGNLKKLIREKSSNWRCKVYVEIVRNPDVILAEMEDVVSGDAIIIDSCESWFNLSKYIIENFIETNNIILLDGKAI